MNDPEAWIFLLLGMSGGFLLSFVFWWWINHRLVPEISFSEELSKRPIEYDQQEYRHQFAFKNTGARLIINIRIKARLVITDPRKNGSLELNYYNITLSNYEFFELEPERTIFMAPLLAQSIGLETQILDEALTTSRRANTLTLEGVFDIYPDSFFYVQAIGTDIYSNATKVFQSKNYKRQDVRLGVFKRGSLNISALKAHRK